MRRPTGADRPIPGRGKEAAGLGVQHGCPGWQLICGLAAVTDCGLVPKPAAIEASVSPRLMT